MLEGFDARFLGIRWGVMASSRLERIDIKASHQEHHDSSVVCAG